MEGYKRVELERGGSYNVFEEHFSSLHSLVVTNASRPNNGMNERWSVDKYFTGVSTYEEAERLAKNGYDAPVAKMLGKLGAVKTTPKKRMVIQNGIVGYAPNVPNYLQGLPDSMIDMKVKRFPMKVVRIKYLCSYNCLTTTEQATDAGMKIVEAVVRLEAEGYRVSVDTIFLVRSHKDDKEVAYMSVRVKDAEQPLDLKKVAYPLIHPSFHRALGFKWFSTSPKCPNLGYGLGTSFSATQGYEKAKELVRKVDGDKHAVVLDIEKVLNKSGEEVLKNIRDMLKGEEDGK